MQLVNLDAMSRTMYRVSSVEGKNERQEFTNLLAQALQAAEKPEINSQPNNITTAAEPVGKVVVPQEVTRVVGGAEPAQISPLPPHKRYDSLIAAAARKHGIEPVLLKALIKTESNFNAAARSKEGALGLTQIMPATARYLGINPLNPAEAIEGGAKYLGQMLKRYNGNVEMALAAYNAGPGNVDRYNGVPPFNQTHRFIHKVKQNAVTF